MRQRKERERTGERGGEGERRGEKTQKRRSIWEKFFSHRTIRKILRFPVKRGANCETFFSVFLQYFVRKGHFGSKSFSMLIQKHPVVCIARQARSETSKKLFQIFRQGANEVLIASMARWEEHLRMLVVLERHCLEHSNERREVLTVLMEGKMNMQEVALEKFPGGNLRGVEGVGGAEDKGSVGTRAKEAQVD